MIERDMRQEAKLLMRKIVDDEARNHTWTYRPVRPMTVPPRWAPGVRIIGDCSKGCQYINYWIHGPDPMGMNFGVYGNSETICINLDHVDHVADLKVADFVTFGTRGHEHAAMVYETGKDPLLWSFGHQGAPNFYRLSYDKRVHQLLRNPLPLYIPTPQDKLRAKTGYFSWIAWKLGEGAWRNYGKSNAKVRPNVPKTIPVLWWKNYAQFITNRKKGDDPTTS